MNMIYTGNTISFQANRKFHQANSSHPQFKQIVELCKQKKFDEAADLLDIKAVVATALGTSGAKLVGSNVEYKGQIVNSLLARRIVDLHREGFTVEPLLHFLDNLMENPSKRAVDELYGFLEVSKLPITDDGHFVAYKSVRQDFTDHHTGTMSNAVGTVVKMERNKVDEDKDRTCSYGLHFAAHEYASNFGASGRMVVLKINPRDVVAIPSDYNNQKGRACEYLVLEEVPRSDTKLVGKAFVDTAPKKPVVPIAAPKKTELLPVGTAVVISAEGKRQYRYSSSNPSCSVGKVVSNTFGSVFVYRVQWPNGISNTYREGEIEKVVTSTPVYTPQADNYGNGKLWAANAKKRVFKGTAEEFPVNRDVGYVLTRLSDDKEYTGEFYFTNYTSKGYLVFQRIGHDGKPERYVTVSNVTEWKITTPTKRV